MQVIHLKQKDVQAQVIRYVDQDIKIPTGGRIVKVYCGKDEDGNKIQKEYIPLYMGFDIETTNIVKGKEYKAAYMYIAQLCIATEKAAYLYIFRRWQEVITFFIKLQKYLSLGESRRVICFIANESFEFQFLRRRLNWQQGKFDFFAKETRKPLLATSCGIEFREALSISGGGLAELANDFCRTKKLVGDLDYNKSEITGKPRNFKTPMSDTEMQYCYNDVIILSEFAEFIFDNYIRPNKKVPLTKTGLLRAEVKEKFKALPENQQIKQLLMWQFPTYAQYVFWFEYLFRGGYVHANVIYAGQTLERLFKNYDITSSYPYQLNCRYYPMSKFEAVEFTTMEDFKQLLKTKCVIFCATFRNLRQTTSHAIESYSKCIKIENFELDNGRVRKAGRMTVALNEIDFAVYNMFYQWDDDPYIYDIYIADRGYLPPYMLDVLNKHYKAKASMKKRGWHKDPAHMAEYAIEKSGVNAFYGMCVTRIQLNQVRYTTDWLTLSDKLDFEKEKKNQVLLPQWGIYCTSWARWHLLSTLKRIYDTCGNITAYCDTDSLKNLYHPLLQSVIDAVNAETYKRLIKRGLTDPDFADLGKFEIEEDYIRAKFNGAKRYLAEYKDNSVHATIAGLPKDAILRLDKDPFDAFSITGMNIEADISDKLGHAYIDEPTSDIIDGEEMHEESSICLFDMPFKMKIDAVYHQLMLESMRRKDIL